MGLSGVYRQDAHLVNSDRHGDRLLGFTIFSKLYVIDSG